jgi:hypothetical protein
MLGGPEGHENCTTIPLFRVPYPDAVQHQEPQNVAGCGQTAQGGMIRPYSDRSSHQCAKTSLSSGGDAERAGELL